MLSLQCRMSGACALGKRQPRLQNPSCSRSDWVFHGVHVTLTWASCCGHNGCVSQTIIL